ncbi:hypothetical protein A5634_09200 [Mycobacterium asiaticum]|uniref:Uncharacterized protein n=1 Tax=Mycobacterium asiaticum TaxID=1790 RepID=A0A1A3NHY3_MYCAS|nr:hypothetical protein [Mycobacterium asiaticum]OBK21758.1 hypothetical protein A5634_09200 [Mycobacterium asiaticum]
MFVIRMTDGQEIKGDCENLTMHQKTGVLSVRTVDGFEETTTHYSPAAWLWVTHRKRDIDVKSSRISSVR